MRTPLKWTLVLTAAIVLVLAGMAHSAWRSLNRPFRSYGGTSLEVVIGPGATGRRILEHLESQGVIDNAFWTRLYLARYLDDARLKAGEYRFEEALTAPQVLDKLIRGQVMTHQVMIIEGLDLAEIAHQLAASGFGAEHEFLRLMGQSEPIADLDPEATDLEGYLFPDTYAFARGTREGTIVATMVSTFRRHWEQEVATLLGEESGLSVRELVTLASIIEKETGDAAERTTIAGVYANRLRIGMGLFADPTVIYGLKRAGTYDGNLRRRDLESDSPYNTYLHPGLPPGPICSPGLASLLAAARPAEVSFLYFVSKNDGAHVFARTLAEHNRNVERWQKRYWRERWARERAAAPGRP